MTELPSYSTPKIVIDYSEYESIKKRINELDTMNNELMNELKSRDNVTLIVYSGLLGPKIIKSNKEVTIDFIAQFISSSSNKDKVLVLLRNYILSKLRSNWLTKIIRTKIMKTLEL